MGTAVTAARLGDRKKALLNLCLTIFGGLCFLGCQAASGATSSTRAPGSPQTLGSAAVQGLLSSCSRASTGLTCSRGS
jgi:heme/copper-type cytochrome/quinol oxidase subunit 3